MKGRKRSYWVVTEIDALGQKRGANRLYGSVVALQRAEQVKDRGEILSERAMRYRLEGGYFKNNDLVIEKCPLQTSEKS